MTHRAEPRHRITPPLTRTTRGRSRRAPPGRWLKRGDDECEPIEVEASTFSRGDPRELAEGLLISVVSSAPGRQNPYRAAMALLTAYISRTEAYAGTSHRRVLEQAKAELYALCHPTQGEATLPL